jgi:hypothetical protein
LKNNGCEYPEYFEASQTFAMYYSFRFGGYLQFLNISISSDVEKRLALSCCQDMENVFESSYLKNIGIEHNAIGWFEISGTDRKG